MYYYNNKKKKVKEPAQNISRKEYGMIEMLFRGNCKEVYKYISVVAEI